MARIEVLISRIPSVADATSSRLPVGGNATAPGDSPSPFNTADSVRVTGATIDRLPSAAPAWPDATTESRLSSPTTAKRASLPVSGIESVVRTPQQSNEVSQLGPTGVAPVRLPLTTKTRVPTIATACGYAPTRTLTVSPLR